MASKRLSLSGLVIVTIGLAACSTATPPASTITATPSTTSTPTPIPDFDPVVTFYEDRTSITFPDIVTCVEYSPDGSQLLVLSRSGMFAFDTESLMPVWKVTDSEGRVDADYHSDEAVIAASTVNGAVFLHDSTTGETITVLESQDSGGISIDFAPDSSLLAVGHLRGTVRVWDVSTETIVFDADVGSWVYSVSFSGDGSKLAMGGGAGGIYSVLFYWNVADFPLIRPQPLFVDATWVSSVIFSPDSSTLVAGDSMGSITSYDINTGEVTAAIDVGDYGSNRDGFGELAFSPDGSILAAGKDIPSDVVLIDVRRFQLYDVLSGHEGQVLSVDFSPDGRYLASGGLDGLVNIWLVESPPLTDEE